MSLYVHGLNITDLKQLILNNRGRMTQLVERTNIVRRRISSLPSSALKDSEKELVEGSVDLINMLEEITDLQKDYDAYLENNKPSFETDEVKMFTIYTITGSRKVIAGKSIEDAFVRNKYGDETVKILAWYDNGVTNAHVWDSKKREWKRRN